MDKLLIIIFQYSLLFSSISLVFSSPQKLICPKQCICDLVENLPRVSCEYRNLFDVINVPIEVNIFNLRGNVIKRLDDYCFQNTYINPGFYKSLIELDLSDNSISDMDMFAFRGLDKLKVLYLNRNRIEKIYTFLFLYNENLQELDLSFNNFRFLKDESIFFHRKLKILNLSNTQIVQLYEATFRDLPSLEEIDLSGNNMIRLQVGVVKPLKQLKFLSINDNKWSCNADINVLQRWLQDRHIAFDRQCLEDKKSDKMIILPSNHGDENGRSEEDLRKIWNLQDNENNNENEQNVATNVFYLDKKNKSFIELYNAKIPSIWSLIIGVQVGLLLGLFITYFWLSESCKCRKWKRRNTFRRRRQLLLQNTQTLHTDTPPIVRRQISGLEAFPRSHSWETGTISEPVTRLLLLENNEMRHFVRPRAETPPPPYADCANDDAIVSNECTSSDNNIIENGVSNSESTVENTTNT